MTFSCLRALASLRHQAIDLLRIPALHEGDEKALLRTSTPIFPYSLHFGLSIHYTNHKPNAVPQCSNPWAVWLGCARTSDFFCYVCMISHHPWAAPERRDSVWNVSLLSMHPKEYAQGRKLFSFLRQDRRTRLRILCVYVEPAEFT